jgi:hypothetical protein
MTPVCRCRRRTTAAEPIARPAGRHDEMAVTILIGGRQSADIGGVESGVVHAQRAQQPLPHDVGKPGTSGASCQDSKHLRARLI